MIVFYRMSSEPHLRKSESFPSMAAAKRWVAMMKKGNVKHPDEDQFQLESIHGRDPGKRCACRGRCACQRKTRRDPTSATTPQGIARHIAKEMQTSPMGIAKLKRDYNLPQNIATRIYDLVPYAYGPGGFGEAWYERRISGMLRGEKDAGEFPLKKSRRDPAKKFTRAELVDMAGLQPERGVTYKISNQELLQMTKKRVGRDPKAGRARSTVRYQSKPGAHGTLYRYRVTYRDKHDKGFGTTDQLMWAYNPEHVEMKFYETDDQGWEIVSIQRVRET